MKNRQLGFTLIEIAIVMVIIGLLIGGVLKGQALIDNAKIKSVVNDMDGLQAAYYGYLDRKGVTPNVDIDYNIIPLGYTLAGPNTFWGQVRNEGLLKGDPASTTPGVNAMGGNFGIQSSPMGLAGNAVCTSVLTKFAQGIDAQMDDGINTSGSVYGYVSAIQNDVVTTATPATATGYPTVIDATNAYTVLCRQL